MKKVSSKDAPKCKARNSREKNYSKEGSTGPEKEYGISVPRRKRIGGRGYIGLIASGK